MDLASQIKSYAQFIIFSYEMKDLFTNLGVLRGSEK